MTREELRVGDHARARFYRAKDEWSSRWTFRDVAAVFKNQEALKALLPLYNAIREVILELDADPHNEDAFRRGVELMSRIEAEGRARLNGSVVDA